MFDSVGWGEILVLVVAGLFILGPERLPAAAAWLGKAIRQVKEYAGGAREQLRSELGPEFEELRKPLNDIREPLNELRGLRNFDPRRAVTRSLFDDPSPSKPNGFSPGSNGAGVNGPGLGGAATRPTRHPATEPRRLGPGELPPIDSDAT